MSYDLYFTSPKISREQFYKYFRDRDRYKVENDQAFYQNEDSGTYFSFDFNDTPSSEGGPVGGSVSFNINFYRPSIFGLEAEPEVRALIEEFSFSILDPQTHGMDTGPYSRNGFLEGWNAGNDFGYASILQAESHPTQVYAKPAKELFSTWEWNFNKNALQLEKSDNVFVPRIFYLVVDGVFGSVAVWPDGIPTVIPIVDFLFIPRKDLAPKKFFRRIEDKCIIPFEQAREALEQYRIMEYSREAFEIPSPKAPAEIQKFVASLEANSPTLETISFDSILDLELVHKHNVDTVVVS